MNRRFFKALVFGVLTFGAVGSFVGCKDYDDDIDRLDQEIKKLNKGTQDAKSGLEASIKAVEQATQNAKKEIAKAQAAADEAKKAADKGVAEAKALAAQGTAEAKKAAEAKIAEAQAAAMAKIAEVKAGLEAMVKKSASKDEVAALKAELEGLIKQKASEAELSELIDEVTKMNLELMKKASAADLQSLRKIVTNLAASLQTKASAEDLAKLRKEFEAAQDDLVKLKKALDLKADKKDLATKADKAALEQTIKDLEAAKKELNDLKQKFADHKADYLKKIETALEGAKLANELKLKLADLEEKAATKKELEDAKAGFKKDLAQQAAELEDKIKTTADGLKTLIAQEKEAVIKIIDEKAEQLKKELKALDGRLKATEALSQENQKAIAVLQERVKAFVGSRLTSISLIPEMFISGIPAIKISTFEYIDKKKHNSAHQKYGFVLAGDEVISDEVEPVRMLKKGNGAGDIVKFRLSPNHIEAADLEMPYFESFIAENTEMRAVDPSLLGKNTPIRPVPGQMLDIKDGILSLRVERSVNANIDGAGTMHPSKFFERFFQASLSIPVADRHLSDLERADKKQATITSEVYRIAEVLDAPRIKSRLAIGTLTNSWAPDGTPDLAPKHYRPYALDTKGLPIHYSDSTMLHHSDRDNLVDVKIDWRGELKDPSNKEGERTGRYDLLQLVTVCTESSHETIDDYEKYGLKFHFAVAKGNYGTNAETNVGGSHKTNQQAFAEIVDDHYLKSRVYTIGGVTETAVGREPIIRVSLVDTNNGNALVDQRYIKVKWIKELFPRMLKSQPMGEAEINCEHIGFTFGTQPMNEHIYRQIEKWGLSKEQFHKIYTTMEIKELKKGSKSLSIGGTGLSWTTNGADPIGASDIHFIFNPDPMESTSFNLAWYMSPKAVGDVVNQPGREENYKITVVFKSSEPDEHPDITMPFTAVVKAPSQKFYYQGTYWDQGKGNSIFNVNPLVYNPKEHGHPAPAPGKLSHISVDLMDGYIYKPTKKKPANVAQFIQKIRGCADVKFVFDEDRFHKYSHLAGFEVGDAGTELWYGAAGSIPSKDMYVQGLDNLAATIDNHFGATAEENAKNLPYDENEPLGSMANQATAMLRLHEMNDHNGTDAAKKLIGKKVPVNLLVIYNKYNIAVEQQFEVLIIDPLKVNGAVKGAFKDAVVGGSFIDAQEGLVFTDWDDNSVSKVTPPADLSNEKKRYAEQLYKYYAVREVAFDIANVKTSLTLVGSTYQHDPSVKDGVLPTKRSLHQADVTKLGPPPVWTDTPSDPTHLIYFNNSGAPVNVNYFIYIDVMAKYKWGILEKPGLKIEVRKPDGL